MIGRTVETVLLIIIGFSPFETVVIIFDEPIIDYKIELIYDILSTHTNNDFLLLVFF